LSSSGFCFVCASPGTTASNSDITSKLALGKYPAFIFVPPVILSSLTVTEVLSDQILDLLSIQTLFHTATRIAVFHSRLVWLFSHQF
jgi:hypothetical protein